MPPGGIDRRQFLTGTAGLIGLGGLGIAGLDLLAACGGSSPTAAASPSRRPPIGAEPGALSILDWSGYEAAGTKAQAKAMNPLSASNPSTAIR